MSAILKVLVSLMLVAYVIAKPQLREKRSSVCYGDLGCFSTGGAFFSLHRPLNLLPQSPAKINVRFMLYTRQNRGNSSYEFLRANDYNSIRSSRFNSARPTKMISHGFLENGFVYWMLEMKDALLQAGDFNVILIDWGHGSGLPYTQATANTRVVGAEIAKLIKVMQKVANAEAEDFHIIGHSLGAHIAGYAGERTLNLGRITGLDPADPYFQYTDKTVRLDPTDANFVDVLHTDGESILSLGFGMIQPCGHVDYFPNSGMKQPGCDKGPITQIRLESDLYKGAAQFVACNHLRSYAYFTESINSKCPFRAYQCDSYDDFKRGTCLPCSGSGCGYLGYHADKVKPPAGRTHVKYYLDTGDARPFCRYHYEVDVEFSSVSASQEEHGKLYVNVFGTNGQLGEHLLTPSSIDVQPGHTYGFVFTSTHDVGQVTKVGFRWDHDSKLLNPFSWNILNLRHPKLYIHKFKVTNGAMDRTYNVCGQDTGVETDVSRTFSHTC